MQIAYPLENKFADVCLHSHYTPNLLCSQVGYVVCIYCCAVYLHTFIFWGAFSKQILHISGENIHFHNRYKIEVEYIDNKQAEFKINMKYLPKTMMILKLLSFQSTSKKISPRNKTLNLNFFLYTKRKTLTT